MKRLKLLIVMAPVVGLALKLLLRRSREDRGLGNNVVLITGGSRGLGLLLAREFGNEGCRVAICARDRQELERAEILLQRWGVGEVMTSVCDVADQDQVRQWVADVRERWGRIDIVVNNAGVIQTGPLTSQTLEDFRTSMQVMFWPHVYTTLATLPQMLQRHSGHIVNITSIGGKVAVPHLLPYDTAKFAATAFSEGLTAELAGTGVYVTTVIPGLMRTGSYLNAYFKGQHEKEFYWFGLASNLPLFSMDAERAARQIVQAVKRRDVEVILGLQANLLAKFHGIFPGLTMLLSGLVRQWILPPGTDPSKKRGISIQEQLQSPLFDLLTSWGRSAGRRFNQYPVMHKDVQADEWKVKSES